MIIDVHTHFMDFEADTAECLHEDMRNCGIDPASWQFTEQQYLEATRAADRVITFGLRGAKTGWLASNERVADFVSRHPERFIYFVSIDPSEPDAMEQLKYAVDHRGAQGVKVGPIYQGIHPLDSRYDPIYAFCEKMGLPLMTHMATTFTASVPLDYARPIHMDEVACRYPELRIVLAHMGHPWMPETLAVIRRHRHVYSDVSALYYRPWQFYQGMNLAVEYGCAHKLLMGSDYPATTTEGSIGGILNANRIVEGTGLPAIPMDVLKGVIHAEALSLLGIDPHVNRHEQEEHS